jgi:hypothetical protein
MAQSLCDNRGFQNIISHESTKSQRKTNTFLTTKKTNLFTCRRRGTKESETNAVGFIYLTVKSYTARGCSGVVPSL